MAFALSDLWGSRWRETEGRKRREGGKLEGRKVFYSSLKSKVLVTQSCPTLCDPMDCSPPGSSVHGILQARLLEWLTIPFSRESSQSRDWTQVPCIEGRFFTIWSTREAYTLIRKRLISVQYMDTRNICHSHLGSMNFSIKTLGDCLWICTFLGRCRFRYIHSITAKVF